MDASKKLRVDSWIETVIYDFFEKYMQQRHYPTPEEATLIAPFLQMYQAIKEEATADAISSLETTFMQGYATVSIQTGYEGIDVNVKDKAKEVR